MSFYAINSNYNDNKYCQNFASPIVRFKGTLQEDNNFSNSKKMSYYIGAGALVTGIGVLIATLHLRKSNAIGKTMSTKMTKEIEKMYDELVEFVGVKRKPKLKFTTDLGKPKNLSDTECSSLGFYHHPTNTLKINPDAFNDKHILIFRNKQNPQQVILYKKFGLKSDIETLLGMSQEEKVNFMKKLGISPEKYSMIAVKPTQSQIKVYLLKTIIHELRHAKQYEIIHRTYGFEKVIEIEKQKIINDLLKQQTTITTEDMKQIEQEIRKSHKDWKNCPVDIDINSKEGQLAKKLFGNYIIHDNLSYNSDPFEVDAYQFERSKAVIDYLVKLTGISAKFVNIS